MPIIDVNTLSFSFSARPLLRGISLTVGDGERAALVGPNGCGKTTLLRVIRGELTPDGGSTTIRGVTARERLHLPSATWAYTTAAEYLQATLAETFALLTRFNDIAAGLADDPSSEALANEYDATLASLDAAEAWSLDSRIDETLAGLGLSQVAGEGRSRRLDALSPGQVARLELAALLLTRPAVLILDEPTNHLDDGAVAYLVEQIRSWQGPVLFSSHDRAFIEAVATVIYDLDTAPWEAIVTAEGGGPVPGVFRCAGTYSDYLAAKTRARAEHRRIHSAQQEEKRELTAHRRRSEELARGGVRLATAQGMAKKFFADRAAATAVRRTQHDDQRLDTLATHEVRKPRNYDLRLTLPTIAASTGLAVSARGAAIPSRLARITFDLAFGEHLLLTGANGAGKSTLLQWIAAGHPPHGAQQASGTIHAMGRIVCVPQQLPTVDDPLITPTFWEEGIGDLGAGILHPSLWRVPIAQLSDGNQRRVQIAVAIAQTPDILVIDEPTNYLDLATIEELERALSAWSGTLIVASHDRWLIDHWQGMRRELQPARA